ncbi:hypothetical protein [Micromonospora auratinigra]|uniref:Uncharacterized protein n=1 Tax=Micromonospora auratinigra TaxID=261654 RepID=A0A1A9A7E6_9ACTN|nr:hypothetical protein [Micromonospora auratinigra]SBT52399.1 hypothetical protein GA0070611_5617 [Micromonospora auratinigra]
MRRRLRGVTARTRAAVRRVEDAHYWPDAVYEALNGYAWVLHAPGRWLNGPQDLSPGIEPEDHRELLDEVLDRLPPAARRDLGRIVDRLDREFHRRTVPVPWPVTDRGRGRGWWWCRLREL